MRPATLALGLALSAAGGCRTTTPAETPAPPPAVPLPPAARVLFAPDVSQVSAAAPAATPAYFALAADDARRRACQNATAAKLIDQAAAVPSRGLLASHTDALRKSVAVHLSAEARNRTAAGALELYYRLLEAELLSDALAATRAEVDDAVKSLDILRANGFAEPADAVTLRTRQLTLDADRDRLQAGIRRLNTELKPLLGLEATPGNLLPTDALVVPGEPLDVDRAVAVGLAGRPDLNAVRALLCGLDGCTAAVARAALASLVPGLPGGPDAGPFGPLLAALDRDATDAVRAQLRLLLTQRERAAATAIRSAADDWDAKRAQVGFAKRRAAAEEARVTEFETRARLGQSVDADRRRARLAKLEADADVTRAAVAWKLADVALRREIGILCGP